MPRYVEQLTTLAEQYVDAHRTSDGKTTKVAGAAKEMAERRSIEVQVLRDAASYAIKLVTLQESAMGAM